MGALDGHVHGVAATAAVAHHEQPAAFVERPRHGLAALGNGIGLITKKCLFQGDHFFRLPRDQVAEPRPWLDECRRLSIQRG